MLFRETRGIGLGSLDIVDQLIDPLLDRLESDVLGLDAIASQVHDAESITSNPQAIPPATKLSPHPSDLTKGLQFLALLRVRRLDAKGGV